MSEKTSKMFITGPQVVKVVTGESVSAEELGSAEMHSTKSGVSHFVYKTDEDCLKAVRDLVMGKVILEPAYITETEVLALASDGYALCAATALPLSAKTNVRIIDPIQGLVKAVEVKSQNGEFAPLDALYVRKSSAEINLCK